MKDHAVFIEKKDQKLQEFHDLSEKEAFKMAMNALYDNGKLVPQISLSIRTTESLVFTATNPLIVGFPVG
jgi:hypothetical protein